MTVPALFKNAPLWFRLFVLLRKTYYRNPAGLTNGVMSINTVLDGDTYRLQYCYDTFRKEIWMRVEIKKVATKGEALTRFVGSLVDFRVCYAFKRGFYGTMAARDEGEYEMFRHDKYRGRELPTDRDIDAEQLEMVEQIVMRVLLENDMDRV